MRKVASRLGIGAMSLYTYVPGRSELIELMIDRVYAEHALPDPGLSWRARLEQWTRATWATYAAHPWLLDYNMARLPIGPHVLDVEESLYAALYAAGFTGAQNVAIANLIRWQLIGAARSTIGDAAEERHTGVSAEAYWESRASFWDDLLRRRPIPDHGRGVGGRRLRRPGRLGLRADDHPTAGRHRAVGARPGGLGAPTSARRSQLERLALVAPAEDAPEEVLVLRLRAQGEDFPIGAVIALHAASC